MMGFMEPWKTGNLGNEMSFLKTKKTRRWGSRGNYTPRNGDKNYQGAYIIPLINSLPPSYDATIQYPSLRIFFVLITSELRLDPWNNSKSKTYSLQIDTVLRTHSSESCEIITQKELATPNYCSTIWRPIEIKALGGWGVLRKVATNVIGWKK